MKRTIIVLLSVATIATSCKEAGDKESNALLRPFTTPMQTPPFDRIKLADYKPAFLEGIRQQEEEIKAIVENPEAPTFANTIAALDASGELLDRVSSIFFNLLGADTREDMQALARPWPWRLARW